MSTDSFYRWAQLLRPYSTDIAANIAIVTGTDIAASIALATGINIAVLASRFSR